MSSMWPVSLCQISEQLHQWHQLTVAFLFGLVLALVVVGANQGNAQADHDIAHQLAPAGDNVLRVWNFNNNTQTWSVHDPAIPELSDLDLLVDGMVIWVLVDQDIEPILNGIPVSLTCAGGNCWNLIVW